MEHSRRQDKYKGLMKRIADYIVGLQREVKEMRREEDAQ